MRALTFSRFGGPEVLELREVPDPVTKPGHVIVRVAVAGLNFADVYRRRGNYHLVGDPPWILGYEAAGVVAWAAPGSSFREGDRVAFADSPHANAELVSVEEDKLVALPPAVSFETASAVMLQGLTAQYLTRDSYDVKHGDVVLVHAAGGGVGLLLCQMAASRGARVLALASSADKRLAAREAGASVTLAYDDWVAGVRHHAPSGVDVVYESVGTTLDGSLDVVRIGGTVVFYGFAGGAPQAVDARRLMDRSLTLTGGDLWNVLTSGDTRRRRAAKLFDEVASGALKVRIGGRFALADGAKAHAALESRAVIGKVVLSMDWSWYDARPHPLAGR